MTSVDWSFPDLLEGLLARVDLDADVAEAVLDKTMDGELEPAQIAALLTALRAKGESAVELAGFVRSMVAHAASIEVEAPMLDTCGTGGDRANTFNISTLAAIVCAAAGVRVAKHGNRSASSACGSADILEAWGVVIDLPPVDVAKTIAELGIGFLFARTFHPAMKEVAPVRTALGVRTIFNLLGPLSNPAGATHQVVGVADVDLAPVMAGALSELGKIALVFHGAGGLDELTTSGPSTTWEVREGEVTESSIDPAEFGFAAPGPGELTGGDVESNLRIADGVLAGKAGAAQDIVALNAGAALWISGTAGDMAGGIDRAREVLSSGAAKDLLNRWVTRSQQLAAEAA